MRSGGPVETSIVEERFVNASNRSLNIELIHVYISAIYSYLLFPCNGDEL